MYMYVHVCTKVLSSLLKYSLFNLAMFVLLKSSIFSESVFQLVKSRKDLFMYLHVIVLVTKQL